MLGAQTGRALTLPLQIGRALTLPLQIGRALTLPLQIIRCARGGGGGRERRRLADSSAGNSSRTGSHWRERRSLWEAKARWPREAERWPISSWQLGRERVRMQSKKLAWWLLAPWMTSRPGMPISWKISGGGTFDGAAAGHGGDPAAFADEEAAEVAGEAGGWGDGVVGVFDHGPVIDEMEQRAVGVAEGHGRELAGTGVDDVDGAGFFEAEGELDDVGGVGEVPGDGGGAEGIGEGPGDDAGDGVDVIEVVEVAPGGGADPEGPIEAGRDRLAGDGEVDGGVLSAVAFDVGGFEIVVEPAGPEEGAQGIEQGEGGLDLAEAAGADELDDAADGGDGAVLGAGLEDAGVAADGRDELAAFVERDGDGFFAVDVFAGLGGVDGHEGVPVVGGDDDDGVDIGAGEDFAVVVVGGAGGVGAGGAAGGDDGIDGGFGGIAADAIDIADGEELDGGVAGEAAEMAGTHAADADEGEGEAIAGGGVGGAGFGGEGGEGEGGGGVEELAASEVSHAALGYRAGGRGVVTFGGGA